MIRVGIGLRSGNRPILSVKFHKPSLVFVINTVVIKISKKNSLFIYISVF